MEASQQTNTKRVLYAVVYNRWINGQWDAAPIFYTHAECAAEAWNKAQRMNGRYHVQMVAAAPTVGYFVEDNHGEKLSAS